MTFSKYMKLILIVLAAYAIVTAVVTTMFDSPFTAKPLTDACLEIEMPVTHLEITEADLTIEHVYEIESEDYLSLFPEEYILPVLVNADRYDLDIDIIYRWMFIESKLGKYTESLSINHDGSTDYGALQLNSRYLDYFAATFFDGPADSFDPLDPYSNIQVACAYLTHLIEKTGSLEGAFVAYNGGVGNYLRNTAPEHSKEYGRIVIGDFANTRHIDIKGMILELSF